MAYQTVKAIYHPGSGQARASDGTSLVKKDGTNLAYLEQQFIEGQNKQVFFHGVVAPDSLDRQLDFTMVAVFRQQSAGAGNIFADILYGSVAVPANRDGSALTTTTAAAVAMPGSVGAEVAVSRTVSADVFNAGEEILMAVKLDRTNAADTFAGQVGLVRLELTFPVLNYPNAYEPKAVNAGASPYQILRTDQLVVVDTTAGVVTVKLPNLTASIVDGLFFHVKDVGGNAATHNITVARFSGSHTIDGATADTTISANYGKVKLVHYNGAWYTL